MFDATDRHPTPLYGYGQNIESDLMSATTDEAFTAFALEHRGGLARWARILTVHDAHLAEDLVQQTLVRVYLHWRKASREPLAYARRTLLNVFLDHRRRASTQRELATDEPPEVAAWDDHRDVDTGLLVALAELPDRMRAAVVLRHVEGLSVAETATVLDVSEGTVKSQTARGLDKLRERIQEEAPSVTVPSISRRGYGGAATKDWNEA